MRKLSLVLSVAALGGLQSQALAQDLHIQAVQADAFERAPMGVNTSINLRIPLGEVKDEREEVRYDFTLAYGQSFDTSSQPLNLRSVRTVELAQVNFDNNGARDMQVVNLGLTNFGRKDIEERQLNVAGGGPEYFLLPLAVGVGVALLVASGDEE